MRYLCIIFLAILSSGCSNNNNQEQVAQLSMQLDSTRVLLDSLIKMQSRKEISIPVDSSDAIKDSITGKEEARSLNEKKSEKKELTTIEKKKDQPKPTPTLIQNESDPKAYFYKGGKNISVQIINGERRSKDFVLFDPWGKETYRFEQRIESYSVTVDLVEWHSNGALHKAVVHTNPGASMYWYTAEYTFGINNEPLWMVSTQHPQTTVSLESDNSYFWDVNTKSWKKQEIVREQPVPRD